MENIDKINIVVSQTNYDLETAKKKMKEWDNDYELVIKEYLNPNFMKKKEKKKELSLNQKIMGEIRDFMDDVTRKYEYRKKKEEFIKNLYIKKMQEMQENKIIIEENENNSENEILQNSNIADNKNNNDDNPETINV